MTNYENWNQQLVAFHRAFPGSSKLFTKLRLPDGETSYDLLASRIHQLAPHARNIVDVGCGDGTLLERIRRLFGPQVQLIGIDLSEADLARARERLPSSTFIAGDAAALDLGQRSQDVATSHLAFMVMSRLGLVLKHVREALRPDGMLVFVSEDPLAGGAILELLVAAVRTMRDRFGTAVSGVPEREPIERGETLLEVLTDAGFRSVEIEPFCPSACLSPEELWSYVELSYPIAALDADARSALHDTMRAEIAEVAGKGDAGLAIRLVTARV
jgi:ubiquinone/menaquinone biosynthesis C-methylase UbiE